VEVKKKKNDRPCTTLTCTEGEKGLETVPLDGQLVPVSESPAQVLKAKRMKFSGSHLPLVHCNVCVHSQVCPLYKAGYECG
jgi:hypothetical protein